MGLLGASSSKEDLNCTRDSTCQLLGEDDVDGILGEARDQTSGPKQLNWPASTNYVQLLYC